MRAKDITPRNPAIRSAIEELKEVISKEYPSTQFTVSRGEDPVGIYLRAEVPVDDAWPVIDVYMERLLRLQVELGLPVHVVTIPLLIPNGSYWRSSEEIGSETAKTSESVNAMEPGSERTGRVKEIPALGDG